MKNTEKHWAHLLTFGYLFFLMAIFPLYSEGNYFNIVTAKWKCLRIITVLFLILWIAGRIISYSVEKKVSENDVVVKNLRLDIEQVFLVLFGGVVLMSAIFSDYQDVVWQGAPGRYTGVVFMLLFVAVFLVSNSRRFIEYECTENSRWLKLLMAGFVVVGALMAVWTILNFVGIDIFGMHEGLYGGQVRNYVAGIGNIVFLGNYFCMIVPCAMLMMVKANSYQKQVLLSGVVVLTVLGTFLSGSDSAVIVVMVILLLFLPFFINSKKELLHLWLVFVMVCFAGTLAKWIGGATVYENGAFDTVMIAAFEMGAFWKMYIFASGLFAVMMLIWQRSHKRGKQKAKIFYYFIMSTVCIVALLYIIVPGKLLVINDSWGTGRGYAWRSAVQIFQKEPFWHKLIGNGPDTFAQLLVEYTGSSIGPNGQYYDNAHCEFLQYLLSFGVIGIMLYTVFIGGILIKLVKNGNIMAQAVAVAMTGYIIQSFVGLNQIVTTPIFFALVIVGQAIIHYKKL